MIFKCKKVASVCQQHRSARQIPVRLMGAHLRPRAGPPAHNAYGSHPPAPVPLRSTDSGRCRARASRWTLRCLVGSAALRREACGWLGNAYGCEPCPRQTLRDLAGARPLRPLPCWPRSGRSVIGRWPSEASSDHVVALDPMGRSEAHSNRPSGLASTCTFIPCRLRLILDGTLLPIDRVAAGHPYYCFDRLSRSCRAVAAWRTDNEIFTPAQSRPRFRAVRRFFRVGFGHGSRRQQSAPTLWSQARIVSSQ